MTFLRNTWYIAGWWDELHIRAKLATLNAGEPSHGIAPVLLPTDKGTGRARRVLERLIAAERAQGG